MEPVNQKMASDANKSGARESNRNSDAGVGAINQNSNQNVPSIRTRSSPKPLYTAIKYLSKTQRESVREMGLEGLLDFNINRLPGKLGFIAVNSFDDEDLVFNLPKGTIKVTKQQIYEMFGVPYGGLCLKSLTYNKVADAIWDDWFKQYNKKFVSPNEIAQKLSESDVADMNFKLNFIVLFTSVLGGSFSRGTCNLLISKYLRGDTSINNIDWCGFLFDCLKKCKVGWKNNDNSGFFVGPLILLTLIYVNETKVKGMCVKPDQPGIRFWSYEQIKKREDIEVGFGAYVYLRSVKAEFSERKRQDRVGKEELETPKKDGTTNDEKRLIFARKMEDMIKRILDEKEKLEESLREARLEFPGSQVFDAYSRKVNQIFRGKEVSCDVSYPPCSQWWHDSMPEINQIMESHSKSVTKRSGTCERAGADIEPPSFSLGMTQLEVENVNNQIVCSQQTEECVDVEPLSVVKPNIENEVADRPRRAKRVADAVCSPFYNRIVDYNEGCNTEENQVWKYIQAGPGLRTEIVFQIREGVECVMDMFHSMLPENWVSAPIIDCWAALLNLEEERRDIGSRKRLFLHSGILKDGMIDGSMSHANCFKLFVDNIEEVVMGDRKRRAIPNVDLVFFPVIHNSHFYVVCFDLKEGSVVILDNMVNTLSFDEQYKGYPNRLKTLFVEYLAYIGHGKSFEIGAAEIDVHELKWGTYNNFVDCGVFVMRHMEAYAGEQLGKWDCGLGEEGRSQKLILNKLRKKYCLKLLLSDHNLQKAKILLCSGCFATSVRENKKMKARERGKC